MEFSGQDKDTIRMPSSLVYIPPIRESSSKLSSPTIFSTAGERRRDETGNGTPILSRSQTLDHHHQQQPGPPPHEKGRDPDQDPDPVPVSIAIAGAPVAPIVGGSNSRTPTRRTTTKTAISTRYRECLKNHAASIGGHVVDGCGEFMPSGEEGTPEALKCAACECHRNFHRKEIDGEPQSGTNCYYYYNPNSKNNSRRSTIPQLPPQLPAPPLQHHQKFPLGLPTSPSAGPFQPMMMAFGGGGATESSSEDINVFNSSAGGVPPHQPPLALSKKRFRTKFSQEQKGKMMEFAEKVGWRIQKQDEPLVLQFCAEVGVKKQVFKVWMHNNKHSMKNKPL